MSWIARSADWRLLTVTTTQTSRDFRYLALAPGCDNRPHDGARCGCRMFDRQADGDRYIRDQMRR